MKKSTEDILKNLVARKEKADSLPEQELLQHQAAYDSLCRRVSAYMIKLLVETYSRSNKQLIAVCDQLADIITRLDCRAFFDALKSYTEAVSDPIYYQFGFMDYNGPDPWSQDTAQQEGGSPC